MEKASEFRMVEHPDKLYIHINDEDANTLSFSFNDDLSNDVGIDPNSFDVYTLQRAMYALRHVYTRLYELSKGKIQIKPISK